jgi:hypothetical protein
MNFQNLTDLTLDSLCTNRSGEQRTPGCHLSDIMRSLQQTGDPKTYGEPGSPFLPNSTTQLRFEAGFTFERVLELAFADRRLDIVRIGEVELDGVIGSPDGVILEPNGAALTDEYKWTWRSSRGTPWPCEDHEFIKEGCDQCVHVWGKKHLWYIWQLKSYTKMLGLTGGILRVFFVNGDYSTMSPQYRSWRFEWTEEELAQHWLGVIKQGKEQGLLR